MADQLPFGIKLAHNIGLIVLASQDLERHLKLVVAASDDHGGGAFIARHQKLERRALGELVGRLMDSATVVEGSASDLHAYFSRLLDRRNKVVHHFSETYGDDLRAGRHGEVLASLAALCKELREVAASFERVNESWLEALQQEPPFAHQQLVVDGPATPGG